MNHDVANLLRRVPARRREPTSGGEQASGEPWPSALGVANIKCGLPVCSHAPHRRDAEIQVSVEVPLDALPGVIRSLVCGPGTGSKMHVKIDEAWHKKLPRPVDFFNSGRDRHIRAVPHCPNARSGYDDYGIGERWTARAINQHSPDDGFLD